VQVKKVKLNLVKRLMKAEHHANRLGAGAKARRKYLHGKEKIPAVMHEFKHHTLHSGSGAIVKSRKQAIRIAMEESRK
jgi:hypothetical protein